MDIHADKIQESKSQSVSNDEVQIHTGSDSTFQFVDNRPDAVAQRKLQEIANKSPRVAQLKAFQEMADNSPEVKRITQLQAMADSYSANQQLPIQRQENKTGLPDQLKSGMESVSGLSLSDVKVHRNSDKPAQLQAHAYAQGTDIHLGPGQEKHLPHELGHVVQQKKGRVKPTVQLKGKVNVNDDPGLEKEADVLGAKALQVKSPQAIQLYTSSSIDSVIQGEFINRSGIIQKEPDEDADIFSAVFGEGVNVIQKIKFLKPLNEDDDISIFSKEIPESYFLMEDLLGFFEEEATTGAVEQEISPSEDGPEAVEQGISPSEDGPEAVEQEISPSEAVDESVYDKIDEYFGYIDGTAGNGVTSNASGLGAAAIATMDVADIGRESEDDTASEQLQTFIDGVYKDINIPKKGAEKVFSGLDIVFKNTNAVVGLLSALKNSEELRQLYFEKIHSDLTPEEKAKAKKLIEKQKNSKKADLLQSIGYAASSTVGLAKAAAGGGLKLASAVAGPVVVGAGVLEAGRNIRRMGKAMTRVEDLKALKEELENELSSEQKEEPKIKELLACLDFGIQQNESKVKFNIVAGVTGSTSAVAGVGTGLVTAGLLGGAVAATVATAGLALGAAAAVGGLALAGKQLVGKFRSIRKLKPENRADVAKLLMSYFKQEGELGEVSRKIIKTLLKDEDFSKIEEKKLEALVMSKLRTTN